MTKPYPLIITNNELLDDWCGTLEKWDPVAVDTEGDSLHCYFEKLCLKEESSCMVATLI